MTELSKLSLLQLLIVIILIVASAPVAGYNDYEYPAAVNDTHFKQLILNIVVDEAGKAFVTGYVEHADVDSLPFLKTSDYHYENDTLNALTNALTWKYGDNWTIKFTTCDYYTEYHTIFYLPGNVKLVGKMINCSEGLEYFVTTSNESLVIDVQGYDVENPMTTIEYQQPLKETGGEGIGFRFGFGYLLLVIALAVLALVLTILIVKMKREKGSPEEVAKGEVKKGEIEVTSEMARVMETLTDRERAIVNALIKHNGEMTQADLRYETGIPKSSLTGILRTLERRKIINKKEWGRTNVIELSAWFLRKKGER